MGSIDPRRIERPLLARAERGTPSEKGGGVDLLFLILGSETRGAVVVCFFSHVNFTSL